jgi:hypothetical protein
MAAVVVAYHRKIARFFRIGDLWEIAMSLDATVPEAAAAEPGPFERPPSNADIAAGGLIEVCDRSDGRNVCPKANSGTADLAGAPGVLSGRQFEWTAKRFAPGATRVANDPGHFDARRMI